MSYPVEIPISRLISVGPFLQSGLMVLNAGLLNALVDWCDYNFGRMPITHLDGGFVVFWFDDLADATLFKLRWG